MIDLRTVFVFRFFFFFACARVVCFRGTFSSSRSIPIPEAYLFWDLLFRAKPIIMHL